MPLVWRLFQHGTRLRAGDLGPGLDPPAPYSSWSTNIGVLGIGIYERSDGFELMMGTQHPGALYPSLLDAQQAVPDVAVEFLEVALEEARVLRSAR